MAYVPPAGFFYHALLVTHILSVVVFLGHLLMQAYWKLGADRSGRLDAIAVVSDGLHESGKWITGPAALIVFASGYAMIRAFGMHIRDQPFALWGLILLFLALAIWYFGMRPLEVKMANLADEAVASKRELTADYAKASGSWIAMLAFISALLVAVTVIMIFKPGS